MKSDALLREQIPKQFRPWFMDGTRGKKLRELDLYLANHSFRVIGGMPDDLRRMPGVVIPANKSNGGSVYKAMPFAVYKRPYQLDHEGTKLEDLLTLSVMFWGENPENVVLMHSSVITYGDTEVLRAQSYEPTLEQVHYSLVSQSLSARVSRGWAIARHEIQSRLGGQQCLGAVQLKSIIEGMGLLNARADQEVRRIEQVQSVRHMREALIMCSDSSGPV